MTLVILEGEREIKGIDSLCSIDTNIEITPSNSIDERLVFIFGIDYYYIMSEHEATEYLEFDGKGFTSA